MSILDRDYLQKLTVHFIDGGPLDGLVIEVTRDRFQDGLVFDRFGDVELPAPYVLFERPNGSHVARFAGYPRQEAA